jgi:hypothetical protein
LSVSVSTLLKWMPLESGDTNEKSGPSAAVSFFSPGALHPAITMIQIKEQMVIFIFDSKCIT